MPQFGLSSPGGTARSEMEIGQPVILWYRLGKDGDSASFNDTTFKKHLKENDLTEYAFAAILWCKFEKSEVKANRSGGFTGVPK
jgi:hypothetical protein